MSWGWQILALGQKSSLQPVFVNKVLLALSHAIIDTLHALVALTVVSTETIQPMLPKIWAVGPFRKKFTDLWYK